MSYYQFTSPIPIRNTSVWPQYSEIATLQVPYGLGVTVKPVQYDQQGREWHVADCLIGGLVSVKVDGVFYNAGEFLHTVDLVGHQIALYKTPESLTGRDIQITVNGKIHPITGVVMTNPGVVMWDIANFTKPIALSTFDTLRLECQRNNIIISGNIGDHTRTTRDYLDEIGDSIGAVVSAGMPAFARLFPVDSIEDYEPIYGEFNGDNIDFINPTAQIEDIKTVARILYDYNHATGEPQKVIQLEATELKKDNNYETEISMPWVAQNSVAVSVGTRILKWKAQKKWRVPFTSSKVVPAGCYANFSHPLLPGLDGTYMMISAPKDPRGGAVDYMTAMPVQGDPTITMTQTSEIFQ